MTKNQANLFLDTTQAQKLIDLGYTENELIEIKLITPCYSPQNDYSLDILKITPEVWPVMFSKRFSSATRDLETAYARIKWALSSTIEEESYQRQRMFGLLAAEAAHTKLQHQSKTNRSNAAKPRLKIWAQNLANDLFSKYENFSQAWQAIPDSDHSVDIYRDGDDLLHYSGIDEAEASLTKESFRTGYWQKEIKRNKKK
ncbi:hypothetical protein [Kerstersia similis]|uniref:hypothetical protein n=1 Tax=Kerstersia similis TaxID=206505 RepID=UPI0039EE75E4